jgi:nucleolar protein 14
MIETLRALRPQDSPSLVTPLQAKHVQLLEKLVKQVEQQQQLRTPLQWRVEGIKSVAVKNPSYTPDYTFKKDMDPDQNRAKLKQLNRQLKRENKAAMRELRRDSDFIDQERFKRVSAESKQRQEERHKNYATLTDSVGELNKQMRMSKGAAKGGGSGVTKKARVR